jgi:tetratricopeptide (TPR) repeat protein
VVDGVEAQIRKYTEQLAQDPKSRAFAPLADLYRQLGRYDEAIHVAREGLRLNPHYVSGKMALARALYENGDVDPARELLDAILLTAPDNLLANRILAAICLAQEDRTGAEGALRKLLEVDPTDARSKKLLDSISAAPPSPPPAPEPPAAAAEPGPPPEPEPVVPEPPAVPEPEPEAAREPVPTATLAELYLAQGHLEEALRVYRELAVSHPANPLFREKILEVEGRMVARRKPASKPAAVPAEELLKILLGRVRERRRTL